jgi:hypothetical protein
MITTAMDNIIVPTDRKNKRRINAERMTEANKNNRISLAILVAISCSYQW